MAKREMKTVNTEVKTPELNDAETEAPKEVPAEKEPTIGVVKDCSKLNIRKKPDGEVVAIVNVKSKLTINDSYKNKDWYKVTTEDNVTGYCIKKYVKVD